MSTQSGYSPQGYSGKDRYLTQGIVTMLFGALGADLVGGGIPFLRRKNGR